MRYYLLGYSNRINTFPEFDYETRLFRLAISSVLTDFSESVIWLKIVTKKRITVDDRLRIN